MRFFIFIVLIIIGCSIGFVFTSIWRLPIPLWMPSDTGKRLETMDNLPKIIDDDNYNNKYSLPVAHIPLDQELKESNSRMLSSMKNPFIIPGRYAGNYGQNISPQKKQAYLSFQGVIETNDSILGLVRVNATGEVFAVYEGEDLLDFQVKKITPSTLTYSQNGNEVVIPLGGIRH